MMTNYNWKKCVLSLFFGLLFMSMANITLAEDKESSESTSSNAAIEKELETFVGALKLGDKKDQEVIDQFKKACDDAKKKVKEKEAEAQKIGTELSKLKTTTLPSSFGAMGGYQQGSYYLEEDKDKVNKLSEQLNAINEELKTLKEQKNLICDEAEEALEDAEGAIYVYTGSDGSKIFFQYDGKTAKAINGVTRGCIPLPMKVKEGKSCIFCPLFEKIFNAANVMSTNSYGVLATALANVMLIGFAIWIAFSLLGKVSSFTKMDAPKYITELLTQSFKVLFAYLLLRNAYAIYDYALGPLLKGGMEFGMTLLSGSNKYLDSCKAFSAGNSFSRGLLPSYLYTQLECFIKAVQAELSLQQAIGTSLMCVSHNSGAQDVNIAGEIISFKLPNLSMLFEGLIIWVFAWLLSLAFAFYLVDATVRLGIVGALMPFLIVCWPFKVTSKYTSQGFTMFMNTFFTYVFMGLVVSINIQLIGSSLSGAPGGMDAIEDALNSNKVKEFKDMLDIGFAGFLILIASCIFGFKLCGQTAELAGSMAGGGGGSSIAPEIAGMGYNVAKSATLGTGKAIGGGAKFLGEATGINEGLRKFRDKAVDKLVVSPLAKVFSFGRSGGGSSSKVATNNQQPKPQNSPASNGNTNTPVSADQARQADRVSNAAPRENQNPQPNPQPNPQTNGASGSTASSQNNNTSTADNTSKPNNNVSPTGSNSAGGSSTGDNATDTGRSAVANTQNPDQQPSLEERRNNALNEFKNTNAGRSLDQAINAQSNKYDESKERVSSLRQSVHGAQQDVLFYENAARDNNASPEFRQNMQNEANNARQRQREFKQQLQQAEMERQQYEAKLNELNNLRTESANKYADSKVNSTNSATYDEQAVLNDINRIVGNAEE